LYVIKTLLRNATNLKSVKRTNAKRLKIKNAKRRRSARLKKMRRRVGYGMVTKRPVIGCGRT
jgi:hypothetical protein